MRTTTTTELKAIREQRGLRQAQLSALSGVSIATLSRAEAWAVPVSPATARKVCAVLHCPVAEAFPYLVEVKK